MSPLFDEHDLPCPGLPDTHEGLRVLHLTDFHVRRGRGRSTAEPLLERVIERLVAQLPRVKCDLIALGGDYCNHPYDEEAALSVLRRVLEALPEGVPVVGIFGNHDTGLMVRLARDLPRVLWLENRAETVSVRPGIDLEILGVSEAETIRLDDSPEFGGSSDPGPYRVMLCHDPVQVFTARAAGAPVVLAGHTHGGQVRLSSRIVPHNATDLPGRCSSGIMRVDESVLAISRGLGFSLVRLRLRCPAQAPIYTLRRAERLPRAQGPLKMQSITRF